MPDEVWPCIYCGDELPTKRSLRAHKEYWHPRYTRTDIEGLINGSGSLRLGAGRYVDVWRPSWSEIRSRIESPRPGSQFDLEDEGWLEVLDLEGPLREMAAPLYQGRRNLTAIRQHAAAAVAISARLLGGFSTYELRDALGPEHDPEKLIRKGAAWIAKRLEYGGRPSAEAIRACDEAFRRAQ